jgi:hypothetical protein
MPAATSRRSLAAALAASALACGGSQTSGGPGPGPEPAGYLGPSIALDAPPRGAMLEGEGGAVALAGRICDAVHPLAAATVNGAAVPLGRAAQPGACRPWSVEVEPRVGLNVVRGEVMNAAGEVGTLAQAFLRAPAYFDAEGDGARAGSGIVLQLGQDFLDDGDRTTLDDVASVIERVVGDQDLDLAVGPVRFASPDQDGDGEIDSVTHGCVFWNERNKRTGFEAWKSGPLTHGGVSLDALSLEDGGIAARLSIRDLRVPFGVMGNVDSGCLGDAQDTVHGDVTVAVIAVEAHAAVGLDGEGRPSVSFTSTEANLTNLDIDIELGWLVDWTGLGSLIGDTIEANVRGRIQSALRDRVRDALGEELARALPALAELGGEIALPPELGGGTIVLESEIDRLEFTSSHALVGASVRVRASGPAAERAEARGAMRLGGAPPDPSALEGDALALAVGDDVLNQVLHAAWLAGAFDLADLGALVPSGGPWPDARITLRSTLPPVVMPRPGDTGGADLGWGDVAFDISLAGERGAASVRGFLSLGAGLERIEAAGGGLRLVFSPDPRVDVQVTHVDWDHLPTTRKLTEGLVRTALENALPDVLGQAVRAFPLPRLDLGALDPSLAGLALGVEATRAERLGRYSVVAGGVVAGP